MSSLLRETDCAAPVCASRNPAFWPGSDEKRALKALRRMCEGKTSDEIGEHLVRQGLIRKARDPGARVRACLNPGKSEFFSPSEILAIEMFTGVAAWTEFCAEAHGCELVVTDPMEAAYRLQARIDSLEAELDAERERLAGIRTRTNDRRLWAPTPGAKFSLGSD